MGAFLYWEESKNKAMIFDLQIILKETPGLDPATIDAVIMIMYDYIAADITNEA